MNKRSIKKPKLMVLISMCIAISVLMVVLCVNNVMAAENYVSKNGNLQVIGTNLCNKNGNPIQLKGMSSHGLQWYSNYVNENTLKEIRDKWGANVIRTSMYVDEGGYLSNPDQMKQKVINVVDTATSLGMYVIIDWHILNPGDPNISVDESKKFFKEMATKYANSENVMYEICNEPNGVDWSTVKKYANQVIPVIRSVDPDNIIICGTPTWSQDVDIASADKLNYKNIMYALHFYSGTHKQSLRDKVSTALKNGIAIFASEWGTSDASGNGGPYLEEAKLWMDFLNKNNISWCNWSLCDKAETSAALNPGASTSGNWSDSNLSESGKFVKSQMVNGTSTKPSNSSQNSNTPTVIPTVIPTVTPTTGNPASQGDLSFNYVVHSDWKNGASVELVLKNNSSKDIEGWEIEWSFSGNQKITTSWNGEFNQNVQKVNVKNLSYNKLISKNSSLSIGFNISYSGTNEKPVNIKVKNSSNNNTNTSDNSANTGNNTDNNKDKNNPTDNKNSNTGGFDHSVKNDVHYGRGTFYGGGYTGGCAMLDGSIKKGEYVCAMNPYDYANARLAGADIELKGPKGTIKLLVTDLLPEGQKGDIDLNEQAFAKIADLSAGEVQVSWRLIPREVDGPVVIRFKEGSTQYWMGVQIRNHKTPIEKVEILTSNGSYKNISRKNYNFFELFDPGTGPFTFRITDIYGKTITEKDIPLKVPGDIKGKNQF